ncbi:GHMP kinase [Gillisia sp. M10.2A]|uniref:GHMP kinase n=1 Tax=Gillisia lutea TaxID=2909668 RepID=A0ABS9ED95_9FLAO|nr:GYDIA family GHMP kinase [Gillisia lutea]MCF4100857.1 GHMP kinase [Gillisia lutea]
MINYCSHGKLLITAEYAVLDGALALAVPTKFGQSLKVQKSTSNTIAWTAYNSLNEIWFQTKLGLSDTGIESLEDIAKESNVVKKLREILWEAHLLNPKILSGKGYKITTKLDFPNDWGLGSSSTLINNIAQWFGIDAYELLKNSFGGSGYDIAAAGNNTPITYQLNGDTKRVLSAAFNPSFKDEIFFVHLNKKQDSRDAIAHYKDQPKKTLQSTVEKISALTENIINCETIGEFNLLIEIHETLISQLINTPKVKSELFPEYPGAIKSLGGWGGDFILATGSEEQKEYFREKGYNTILSYKDMVL